MLITNCYKSYMKRRTPFGTALRYYRKKEKYLTQTKLASKINISQAMISRIEKGIDDGSAETREIITKHFKIPYDAFLEKGHKELEPKGLIPPMPHLEARIAKLEAEREPAQPTDLEQYTITKHQEKVLEFKEQDRALRINSILVEIEKSDFDVLDKIEKMVQLEFDVLKKKERKAASPGKLGESKPHKTGSD